CQTSFLLYYDGGPTDLPSFPTRRSSDLGKAGGEWALNQPTPEYANHRAIVGDTRNVRINEWYATGSSDSNPDFIELANPEPFPVDRKSTRLNSSHVKISYAVFCLKKKKE